MVAGLRRIATSLWLHFVASPQRLPALVTGFGVDLSWMSSIEHLPSSCVARTPATPRDRWRAEHPVTLDRLHETERT